MTTASCLEFDNRGLRNIQPRVSIVREPQKRGYAYYFRKGMLDQDPDTGCILWLGGQFPDGYGKVRAPGGRKGQSIRTQRYFYELYRGSAKGFDVGHKCHRRLCVWVKHLELVTHTENMGLMFQHYHFGKTDRDLCTQLMIEGKGISAIADALMAPRPAVMKLVLELKPSWRQSDLPF